MPVVRIRYFAALRDRKGTDAEDVALLPGETLRALYVRLFPPGDLPVAYARNHATAPPDEVPADGDEIVFLPPVGGG